MHTKNDDQPMKLAPMPMQDLLNLPDEQLLHLSKQRRWQLIDQIDRHADHLQHTMRVLRAKHIAYPHLLVEYRQLRAKRVTIWLGFWPGLAHVVRRASELVAL